jgi:putative endonuclease
MGRAPKLLVLPSWLRGGDGPPRAARGPGASRTGRLDQEETMLDNEARADLGYEAVLAAAVKTNVARVGPTETAVIDVLAYIAHFASRLGLSAQDTFATALESYAGDFEDGPGAEARLDASLPLAEDGTRFIDTLTVGQIKAAADWLEDGPDMAEHVRLYRVQDGSVDFHQGDAHTNIEPSLDDTPVTPDQEVAVAVAHLERLGMEIVARNHRTRFGELAIIALDGDTLVFCEVTPVGVPTGGAHRGQQVRRMAAAWLAETADRPRGTELRFDAISVAVNGRGEVVSLDHTQGDFT